MRAVARLMLAYFTGTPLLRSMTVLGVLAVIGGSAALLYLPPLVAQNGGPSRFSLAQETIITMLPVVGILLFAFGAALMPTMLVRLATSHYAHVLPYGRAKLLASAFGTVALVALVASAAGSVYYVHTDVRVALVFERAFTVSLVSYTILYFVMWFTARSQSIGKLVGTAALIATLVLPLRFIAVPSTSLLGPWIAGTLLWAALAAVFLLAPRLQAMTGGARHSFAERFGGASYDGGGGEIDFMIGTANPWPLALGQIAPILIAAYYLHGYAPLAAEAPPNPWLFFMTILSVVAGAMTSVAATRSRALWLRAHWTRAELFARVERAFWRYNSYSLGVLLVMLVAAGTYFGLPTKMLAFGLGLLALGTALSTYLGLMNTASIGWAHAALAVATMLALMLTAMYASRPATPELRLFVLEGTLCAAAVLFRILAKRRWQRIDWMLCRAEPGVRAAS